ncbi:MAG: glycosyltransferase family 2 protein [Thermoproteota archaeon]|nr:glycosyltransferase family 2 protein [Thermoproteota archaeon]
MAVQNKQPVATEKYREMDKKRWLVRYLVLASIAVILGIKLYLLIYVVDFTVGFYSFLTSFVLFNIFFLSWVKYRDPFIMVKDVLIPEDRKPLVSIIVPVKNEEGNIRNCVQSCLNSSYTNKEVIIVNDGSTDGTTAILDEMRKEVGPGPKLQIIHLSKSVGKKVAIEAGSQIAKGEIYVMMDSDCDLASDAVDNAVKIFYTDRRIGAVTGHARVRGAAKGNTLLKIEDVWFDGQFRMLKGMETSFSSLTCCSGALSIYRREAVHQYIHAWAHDHFLGIENFKFATDRRLTAYVLGAKPEDIWEARRNNTGEQDSNKNSIGNNNIPILQTGKDDLNAMRSSSDPDQEELKKKDRRKYAWRLVYSPSVRVTAGVPDTLVGLIRQQIRWRKSFIRSLPATGGIYWRRPFYAAFLYYLVLGLKLMRPFIVIKIIVLLLSADIGTVVFYLSGLMYTGMLYGIDSRLRNPGYPYWLYRPLFTFMSTFVFSWLLFYAAITIRKEAWR